MPLYHQETFNPYSYRLIFELNGLPKTTNRLAGSNFYLVHQMRKKWKRDVYFTTHYYRPSEPLKKATLKLTRISSHQPDFDGLVSSFKPILDGLKEAKIILDDSMDQIGIPTYLWEKGKKGMGRIEIEVCSHC